MTTQTKQFTLLPTQVRPQTYVVTLVPDLETFTFRGEETVHIVISEPVTAITLNANELQVQSASVKRGRAKAVEASSISYDEKVETVTFSFDKPIPAGEASLNVAFTGTLNDRLHGFYRATYQLPSGEKRTMATTQFEPADARRALPCWDEPSIKATFKLSLVVPEGLAAVSNMPDESTVSNGDGTKTVSFQETPRMSTYLLAFTVADLEKVEARAESGTLVRVWATRGNAEKGRYALETSIKLLKYFNGYFGIPFPLPKLDHIAIPDFAAGAMENWGCITYREVALLVDPKESGAGTRQRVAEIISHEMAHMWFGDLVTMAWWNDLWLNESFASWMGDKAVNAIFPEWDMWTQFLVNDTASGLSLDGLKNSHPIEQEVRLPSDIQQLFDAISYSKGASIIRMLEDFISQETFQKGLYDYLSGHAYANAKGDDLWSSMGKASGQPILEMMNSWIRQTGYPVLETDVQRAADVTVRFKQARFLYDHTPGEQPAPTLWKVPVTIGGKGAKGTDRVLADKREATLKLDKAKPADPANGWVKLNAGQTGFYRVNYQQADWERLSRAVLAGDLGTEDRLGLQEDAYALQRAGFLPASQFLSLVGAYKNEEKYPVWADLSMGLKGIEALVLTEAYLPQLQAFGREMYRPIAQKVGWDAQPGEAHLRTLLRSVVLTQMGGYDDKSTVEEARRRFEKYLKDPSSLNPNLRALVYGMVAQSGGEKEFETLRDMARKATLQEEKLRLQGAWSRFQQPELLQKALQLSLSPEEVRSQDTVSLVTAIAGNKNGRDLTWKFVKGNWPELDRRYGAGGFGLMRLVSITGAFTTEEARKDVEAFFKAHPVASAERTVQQSLERIGLNIRWVARNREPIGQWLKQNGAKG